MLAYTFTSLLLPGHLTLLAPANDHSSYAKANNHACAQGRPDLSLSILLQLRDPGVFGFLETCGAEGRVLPGLRGRGAAQLVAIDEGSALRVLTRAMDVLAPGDVVPGLQVGFWGGCCWALGVAVMCTVGRL